MLAFTVATDRSLNNLKRIKGAAAFLNGPHRALKWEDRTTELSLNRTLLNK